MRGTTYVFLEKEEKLSLNYPQYSLLSGALISSVTRLLHNRIMTPNIQAYLSLSFINFLKSEKSTTGKIRKGNDCVSTCERVLVLVQYSSSLCPLSMFRV